MNVIWEHSVVSVPEIVQQIPRDLAYTTVMTTVRILERKKFIKQCGKRGRAFLYASVFDKEKMRESMSRELARRLYDDSVKSMILNLIERGCVSALGLAEIRRVIKQKLDAD